MNGREGYALVSLFSALQFIASMDANRLHLNPIDYQMWGMERGMRNRMVEEAKDRMVQEANMRLSIF